MRIGLVLGGGGAKGAYQLGVFLALKKHHLDQDIKALSGGSIGALNAVLFLDGDLQKAFQLWLQIEDDHVLERKETYKSRIPIKRKGVFSRNHFTNLLKNSFDLEKILKSDKPVYVAVSRVEKKKIIKKYVPVFFKINNHSEQIIIDILLASSAIPLLYDQVEIENKYYLDYMKTNQNLCLPLLRHQPDCLFLIPLTDKYQAMLQKISIPIIDFGYSHFLKLPKISMINFSKKKIEEYLTLGYDIANTLLSELKKRKTFIGPLEKGSYFSFESLNLTLKRKHNSMIDIIKDLKATRRKEDGI